MTPERYLIDRTGLQRLLTALSTEGYTVLGPTVRDGAVVIAPVTGVEELPGGWGDEQEAGSYRLRAREDGALFGYANGPQSPKRWFFPPRETLSRGRRTGSDWTVEGADPADAPPPYALLGVRPCDLAAMRIQDTVLLGRSAVDPRYQARRADTVIIALTCTDPAATCFCASTGTGPRPGDGYDLALTELLAGGHRFLVDVGTDRGAELLLACGPEPAGAADVAAAEDVAARAAARMGRELETAGLRDLLYAAAESPQWEEVATRCLACSNCTLVCPTCFCTTVEDVEDVAGAQTERTRVWDSCFTADFSYIHGGSLRPSTQARYRQWMTHKLAAWQDQFGMLGCVGCGRCITWCPAGIDITAEAARLRLSASAGAQPVSAGAPPAPGESERAIAGGAR